MDNFIIDTIQFFRNVDNLLTDTLKVLQKYE